MYSNLIILLWAFIGLTILSFFFHATTHPWQTGIGSEKRSIFSLSFWFNKNHIYDIPREEQPSDSLVQRWILLPRLLICNLLSILSCALIYLILSPFNLWRIIFISWSIIFILLPLLGTWWMYWFDPHKDRVRRGAYVYWAYCVLFMILLAFDSQLKIFNIKPLIQDFSTLIYFVKTPTVAKALLSALVLLVWRHSYNESKSFEEKIQKQGEHLGLHINYADWSSSTRRIYDIGMIYSLLIIWLKIDWQNTILVLTIMEYIT